MQAALCKELSLRTSYLNEAIETVYFGGGTPSLLPVEYIKELLVQISNQFILSPDVEITLEANPEDLTRQKLVELKQAGVNRLSIGIQSFQDQVLQWMNRSHNAQQAWDSLNNAREVGFKNISLDLIFAVPHSDYMLDEDLQRCLEFNPQHISTYNLTIETKTVFGHQLSQGTLEEVKQDQAADQYLRIISCLEQAGYQHYEVSNFCLPQQYSRHNQSYWERKPYLGIGPAAHSFDGVSRQYNIAHNHKYIQALENEQLPFEQEDLNWQQQTSEIIMTGLRTSKGVSLNLIHEQFGYDLLIEQADYCQRLMEQGFAIVQENRLILTLKGKLIADQIAADLYVTHD